MIDEFETFGSTVSLGIGQEDDEFNDLRSMRKDVEVKSLGYAVYCHVCGHLIADSENGLDAAGGWFYNNPDTHELSNGDNIKLLDGWPSDMLIFDTKEDAEYAIKVVIANSEIAIDENNNTSAYTEDDFTIKEVFSVIKTVSTLGIR